MQLSVSVCLPSLLPSSASRGGRLGGCRLRLPPSSIPTNQSVRLKLPEEAEPSMRGIVAATDADGRRQPTDRRASNNERNEAMD